MRKTSLIIAFLAVLAACGENELTPREYCEGYADGICERIYGCYSVQELAQAGFPASPNLCAQAIRTQYGCSAASEINLCTSTASYHGDVAYECVQEVPKISCNIIRDAGFTINAINLFAVSCNKVCSAN